jgi:hypothetical protein
MQSLMRSHLSAPAPSLVTEPNQLLLNLQHPPQPSEMRHHAHMVSPQATHPQDKRTNRFRQNDASTSSSNTKRVWYKPRHNGTKSSKAKDVNLDSEFNDSSPCLPRGVRLISSVIGKPTLSIFKEGNWRKNINTDKPVAVSADDHAWCVNVDRVRMRLAEFGARDGRTVQTYCRLHPTADDGRPVPCCSGIELNGVKTLAPAPSDSRFWKAHQRRKLGEKLLPREKPIVHLFVSKEESMVIPFLYGLAFVTVCSLMPGDFVFTIDNRVVAVWERKRESDLMNSIAGALPDQKARLQQVALPAHRITILQEALPAHMQQGAWAPDNYRMGGCEFNSIHRDGFRWCNTSGMMHTVFTVLRTVLSLVEKGSHFNAWGDIVSSDQSCGQEMDVCQRVTQLNGKPAITDQSSAYVPPLPEFGRSVQLRVATHLNPTNKTQYQHADDRSASVEATDARGGRPSQHATKDNNWVRMLMCVPGVGLTSAIGVANEYPSCKLLLAAYDSCQDNADRGTMLCDVRAVVLLKNSQTASHREDILQGPRLGKSKSQKIAAQFCDLSVD